MPDIAGISPQGLGSPVSRGYRELENTTVGMARYGLSPVKQVKLEVVGAYLRSTQPVRGFDATGVPTKDAASDLGWEVDGNASVDVYPGVQLAERFGYFTPGEAAGLLINGNTDTLDAAWELKTEASVRF
jgi:hypothetical protein